MANPGQAGLSVISTKTASFIEGQFGISVQVDSNTLIRIIDQRSKPVASATVKVSYTDAGIAVSESILYDSAKPVNRSYPVGIPLTVEITGAGFPLYSAIYTIPQQGQLTILAVVNRSAANPILRRIYL